MNINQIYKTNCIFRSNNQGNMGKPKVSQEKNLDNFVDGSCRHLAEIAEREVPENGKFLRVIMGFVVPEEPDKKAKIIISHDTLNPKTSRRLAIEVVKNNDDRAHKTYIFKGTKKEILDYLKDDKNYPKIVENIKQLMANVNEAI